MGRPLKWRMLRSLSFFRRDIELEQAQHLRVAVLLDDVDAIMRGYEVMHLASRTDRRGGGGSRSRRRIPLELVAGFA